MTTYKTGITAGLVALLATPALAITQNEINQAFAIQEQGATLTQVRDRLSAHDEDDAARFALGAVDFLMSVEGLVQDAHRHGFLGTLNQARGLAGPRAQFLAWIANDAPAKTTNADLHASFSRFADALADAERTLAGVAGDFSCVIDLPAIRFDINEDGTTTSAESMGGLFNLFPPTRRWENGAWVTGRLVPEDLTVAFDRGDAPWLRGYCHLLMAQSKWLLAHDSSELFDHTAHIFFPEAQIKHDYLPGSTWSLERMMGGMQTPAPFDLTDVLVFFGNMRLPMKKPGLMSEALEHLRASVTLGKEMWVHYDRETDNDREWIPNPDQTAAFSEAQVDAQMRDAWLLFLDEADDILHGRKVLRFWRGDGSRGIDVPKVFNEPQDFDLLYWIQGSAAAPYLREGEFTTPGTWAQLETVFDRRVFRFAFWFN